MWLLERGIWFRGLAVHHRVAAVLGVYGSRVVSETLEVVQYGKGLAGGQFTLRTIGLGIPYGINTRVQGFYS
jgi:hypothetical protein